MILGGGLCITCHYRLIIYGIGQGVRGEGYGGVSQGNQSPIVFSAESYIHIIGPKCMLLLWSGCIGVAVVADRRGMVYFSICSPSIGLGS